MQTCKFHETKTHLSEPAKQGAGDEPFIEATAPDAPAEQTKHRIGFLKGRLRVPDDFDTMRADEILELFEIVK
jgi:hypothetical protein